MLNFRDLFNKSDNRLLAIAILVNLIGLTNILNGDSALYASIAKIMAEKNNFLELFTINRGDWLDKPHFPFWLWALSIKVFGTNSFAFKMPALVFYFISLIYTYLFTKEWYDKKTALIAVLMLSTAMHVIISNNDVRAEPFLMGMLIGAVYHFYHVYRKPTFRDILFGSLLTACAVMTKGVFLLIPVFSAVAGHAIVRKEYKKLLQLRWLWTALLVFVFILPELYCLKVQFTDHPDKVIFG
ncbi:MAG: glycosyltransferase family 39 protein [Bacteroidales bacterium]|nr:glycosyltransferase family 39 protein [Bacteroidales bacterium]